MSSKDLELERPKDGYVWVWAISDHYCVLCDCLAKSGFTQVVAPPTFDQGCFICDECVLDIMKASNLTIPF